MPGSASRLHIELITTLNDRERGNKKSAIESRKRCFMLTSDEIALKEKSDEEVFEGFINKKI